MALRAMLLDLERLVARGVVTPMMAVFRRLRLISCSQARSLSHPAFAQLLRLPELSAHASVIRDGTNKRLRRPGRLTPSLFPISQSRQINLYKGCKFFLRQSRSRAQHFNRLGVDLGYSGRLTSPAMTSLCCCMLSTKSSNNFLSIVLPTNFR